MGFSITGALIVAAILAPNILMLILPPANAPKGIKDAGIIFTVLERAGQAGCFILPVISGDYFNGKAMDIWFALMALFIAAYWALWIRYAIGRDYVLLFKPLLFIPVPMAVFPVAAFAFAAAWGASPWLGIAAAVLAAGHIANSWHSYRFVRSKNS